MKSSQIAAQLFSFRGFLHTEYGLADTFRRLREAGYESVQLTASLPAELTAEKLLSLLSDHGLKAVSSHENAAKIFNETDRIIEKLNFLGVEHLAYPSPHISPATQGEVIALAEQLNEISLKFKEHGITFAYHNHAMEFCRFEGRMMLELIYDHAPDLQGEIDTHWVQRGGGDPVRWIKRLAGRMDVIHLKDYGVDTNEIGKIWSNVPVMKPVGYGNLQWDEIVPVAEQSGVKIFVVEHDNDVPDPFVSFEQSFNFLAENFCR